VSIADFFMKIYREWCEGCDQSHSLALQRPKILEADAHESAAAMVSVSYTGAQTRTTTSS
jgi:hypothetical protein